MTPKSLIEPARHAGTALLRSQTDARLVDLTRDGNERAFEAIVQRYRRPLLRYCSRLLPPTRAEDAVQQAFLSAHRAIHAGDADLNLRPWLYRIAHNASLNLLRQHGFDHVEMSEEIDGVETPPQAFERGERLRTVVAAVQELPERQRSAIVLQAVEGRSYDEIAAELGVTDGAVRQLLNRARNTLREAAAALTPSGLITRIASSGGEATVAERVAQALAAGGGGALLAKVGAALVVTGAVAGGAAVGGLPGGSGAHHRDGARGAAGVAAAAVPQADGPAGTAARRADVVLTQRHGSPSGGAGGGRGRAGDGGGASGREGATREHGDDSGGSGSSGSGDDGGHHGGSGSDDHSGSGDDHSGSGGGSDDSSGHGGDDSGSGSGSGSGSDGGSDDSSHSGSGSSGSGSGSSGSDSSGSGSGSSGSGSDDPVSPVPAPLPADSSGHDRSGSDDGSDDAPEDTPPTG